MTMSSEERRRRVHRAVEAQKRAERGERDGRERAERTDQRRRRKRKRPSKLQRVLPLAAAFLLLVVIAAFGVRGVRRLLKNGGALLSAQQTESGDTGSGGPQAQRESSADGSSSGEAAAAEETTATVLSETLTAAERLAAMYDYDGAIGLLTGDAALAAEPEAQAAAAAYEQTKAALVRQDISSIPHIFFHILVVDSANAFDKSKWGKQADGYNSLMTTIPEFEKMLEVLYNDGFVLVGLHDMAGMQEQPDGSWKMVEKDILLPEGKKALVMSEDDVCYYEYMEGAGFASRMIVGEDGRPTCVYTDSEGNEQVGAYDLVPILDAFIDEHPDFSYQGAKAILAFTGYNGILGYRTDETYDPNSPNYDPEKTANQNIEADRETARQVIKALKEDGYELASHSWGHRDMGAITLEHLKKDTDRWDSNVNQRLLNGECDIIIYPKGADVGDWHAYTHDNEKFDYLWNKGFRYFCNVDAAHPYWLQKGADSLRQGRRPLDGLALWNDIANGKNRLSDLFPDVSAIFDPARPTPVPEY